MDDLVSQGKMLGKEEDDLSIQIDPKKRDDRDTIIRAVEGMKNAVLVFTPSWRHEEVTKELEILDRLSLEPKPFKNALKDCCNAAESICRNNYLDWLEVRDAINSVFEELDRDNVEKNINSLYQTIHNGNTAGLPERFNQSIDKDYRDLATSYIHKRQSVPIPAYIDDLRQIYNKYLPSLTVQEFRETTLIHLRCSFPLRLHEEVEKGVDRIIEEYVSSEKDPRCDQINEDFLKLFIETFDKLEPQEKDIRRAPLYAHKFLKFFNSSEGRLFVSFGKDEDD